MIVADANLWVALLFRHEKTEAATQVFSRTTDWHAPLLCLSELRNVCLGYVRRGLLSPDEGIGVLEELRFLLPAERIHLVDHSPVIRSALESGCTAYDCEYVVLAEQLATPLLTWDKQMLAAFPALAMTPEEYPGRE